MSEADVCLLRCDWGVLSIILTLWQTVRLILMGVCVSLLFLSELHIDLLALTEGKEHVDQSNTYLLTDLWRLCAAEISSWCTRGQRSPAHLWDSQPIISELHGLRGIFTGFSLSQISQSGHRPEKHKHTTRRTS